MARKLEGLEPKRKLQISIDSGLVAEIAAVTNNLSGFLSLAAIEKLKRDRKSKTRNQE